MPINSATYYWAACTGCGANIFDDMDIRRLHETAQEAADEAESAEWCVHPRNNAIIYCDDCTPSWCLECDSDITDDNPRCGDDVWSCASCHTDCGHEVVRDA